MRPRLNLWIEKDGQVVLSTWRVNLLKAIDETGSISSAAERMDVPYRRAWQRIHEMEERLTDTLVVTEVGGAHGGGAQLTDLAIDLMHRFQEFSSGLEQEVEERFESAFGNFSSQ